MSAALASVKRDRLTDEEINEFEILSHIGQGMQVIEISLGYPLGPPQLAALERLQFREWIRLIDVRPISSGGLARVFRVMPEALAWFNRVRVR